MSEIVSDTEYYKQIVARLELYEDILEGMKDIEEGRVVSIEQAFKSIILTEKTPTTS